MRPRALFLCLRLSNSGGRVDANSQKLSANSEAIEANRQAIEVNRQAIEVNRQAIEVNRQGIERNWESIAFLIQEMDEGHREIFRYFEILREDIRSEFRAYEEIRRAPR